MDEEADEAARARLRCPGEISWPHHADHRVPAGDRVVGEKDDRRPAARYLHGTEYDALAGQLWADGP